MDKIWKYLGISKKNWPLMPWVLGLTLILGLLYGGFHARYGLFDVDEAIFTQATREMVQTGTYSMPSYNGEPRYQKPPLIYWLQATTMSILGEDSLWAARLPSALAALGSIFLLGWAIFTFTGNLLWAMTSSAVLGLNLSFLVIGRAATADSVLNLSMLALALWSLRIIYLPLIGREWIITSILTTFGLLAKGPIAGLSAALIVLPLLIMRPDRWDIIRRFKPFKILGLTALGLTPWILLLWHDGRLDFFTQFLFVENLHRFGGGFSNNHSTSLFYYLAILLVGFMPWIFFVPESFWSITRSFKQRLVSLKLPEVLPALAIIWAVGVIVLFSFSKTKLPHYIIPAYPALAIAVGWWFSQRRQTLFAWSLIWVISQTTFFAILLMTLPSIVDQLGNNTPRGILGWILLLTNTEWPVTDIVTRSILQTPITATLWPWASAIGLIGIMAGYVLMASKHFILGMRLMVGSMGLSLFGIILGIVPLVYAYTQQPLFQLAETIRTLPPQTRIIHLGTHKPSVLYHSQRPFLKLEKPLQLPPVVADKTPTVVLLDVSDMAGLQQELTPRDGSTGSHVEILACAGGYCVVGVDLTPLGPHI